MESKEFFKKKSVTVVGIARSGLASALLLHNLGAKVSVSDKSSNELTRKNACLLESKGIEVELGKHSRKFIEGRQLIVLSPGADSSSEGVVWAEHLQIPIISEIELAWRVCAARVIAVTGTNGKTTVVNLLGEVINSSGKNAYVCGNIGKPFSAMVSLMRRSDFVVLETSSFQLERIDRFKPNISVILNFSPNHLDRYKDMQEYLKAKKRIFRNQDKNDYLVLNYKDAIVRGLAQEAKAQVAYFNQSGPLNPNHSAVMAVSKILNIDKETVYDVLTDFKGIEHRLEYAGQLKGIEFINDSKSTTVDSTLWALENINKPVILIAGGRDKGLDFTVLREMAKDKIKRAILLGEAKEKIKKALGDILPIECVNSLKDAVDVAWLRSEKGGAILFSPMCSSFDMFSDFEQRGNVFKEAVRGLIERHSKRGLS